MRFLLIKILVFLFCINFLFADETCGQKDDEKVMFEAYNQPFTLKCRSNLYFTASFLYWQAIEDGLNLAFLKTDEKNTTVKTDFDYKPGFKLGLGVNTHYDNWFLYLEYTRLLSSGHAHKNAEGNENIYPLWISSLTDNSPVVANKASGEWNLSLNLLDFTIARPYYVGSKMIFNFYIGLRTIFIDQKYFAKYQLTSPSFSLAKRTTSSDSWGIGPRIGFDTTYILYKGFKVLAHASANLFYQHYNLSTNFSLQNEEISSDKISYLTPNLEASLGFCWGTYFCHKKFHFDVSALYDFMIFWNQNVLRSFKDLMTNNVSGASGDLMLQGLSLGTRFDF